QQERKNCCHPDRARRAGRSYALAIATAVEEAVTPRSQFDIQSRRRQLIPVAVIGSVRQGVNQSPGPPSQVAPRYLQAGFNRTVAEIDHDEMAIVVLDPTPGPEVLIARIIGPARASAEPPLTIAKYWRIYGREEPGVERS